MLLCPALFAVNQLGARYVDYVPPHALALGRWACALLVLLPFVGARLWRQRAALRREWPDMLMLGALGMWVCGAFVYIGGRTTSATNIGLIYAASPVVVVAVAALVYGERLWPRQLAGIALCLLGVLWVITKGDPARLLSVSFTAGDLWVAVASASWGLYSVLLKYRPSVLDPTTRLAAVMAGGVAILIPTTALETAFHGAPSLDSRSLLTILVLAVVPGVGAYGAYSFALSILGAARTGVSRADLHRAAGVAAAGRGARTLSSGGRPAGAARDLPRDAPATRQITGTLPRDGHKLSQYSAAMRHSLETCMRRLALAAVAALLFAATAHAEDIGTASYRFKWLGPNDRIKVEVFDDPAVPGVACYLSRAETGGMSGALGLAEDPGEASIACRQVGTIDIEKVKKLKSGAEVFSRGASLIWKKTQVVRFYDARRNVLVYLTYTDKVLEGSPKNSISIVPLNRPQ